MFGGTEIDVTQSIRYHTVDGLQTVDEFLFAGTFHAENEKWQLQITEYFNFPEAIYLHGKHATICNAMH